MTTRYLGRITKAAFLFVLLFGISLPASSAVAKRSSLPVVKILSHPASVSHSSQATFSFYSSHWDVDTYLCALDRQADRPCVPLQRYYGLKVGKHHFAVKAVTDGMAGPATHFAWIIKALPKRAVAPTVSISSHPSLNTVSGSATFAFLSKKAKATFACALDREASTTGSGYSPCKSPVTYSGLAPGYHTFAVKAVSGRLSSRPEAFAWIISAVAPANTAPPAVTGTAQVGQTLMASNGSWTGSLPISYAYQWQLCSGGTVVVASVTETGPVFCGDIVGATSASYTIEGAGLLGGTFRSSRTLQFAGIGVYYTLRVVVTATNAAGQAEAASSQTLPVLPAAPVNVVLPEISVANPPATGNIASTDSYPWDSWLNDPYGFSFQWQRCDASGNNCADIAGATSSSYVLQDPDDVGSTLRVTVTAINEGGSASATSLPTAVVVAAP